LRTEKNSVLSFRSLIIEPVLSIEFVVLYFAGVVGWCWGLDL